MSSCEKYLRLGNLVIFSMMEKFCIDKKGRDLENERNWKEVKEFVRLKMTDWIYMMD